MAWNAVFMTQDESWLVYGIIFTEWPAREEGGGNSFNICEEILGIRFMNFSKAEMKYSGTIDTGVQEYSLWFRNGIPVSGWRPDEDIYGEHSTELWEGLDDGHVLRLYTKCVKRAYSIPTDIKLSRIWRKRGKGSPTTRTWVVPCLF